MKKKATNELKCFEVIITLPKTGKEYFAVVPGSTSAKVINALDSIVEYIRKNELINIDISEMK